LRPPIKSEIKNVIPLFFWQGLDDCVHPLFARRYEANLVRLIQSLRKDLNATDSKFAIATVAFQGKGIDSAKMSRFFRRVVEAQLAVGSARKHPEFAGTVKSVDVRPLWPKSGPAPTQWHHYQHNAEFYMDVGNALGWAMVELLATSSANAVTLHCLFPLLGLSVLVYLSL
jgi:hypothetical protein